MIRNLLNVVAILLYLCLIAFYGYLLISGSLALGWKVIHSSLFRSRSRKAKPGLPKPKSISGSWARARSLFRGSLFFNFLMAVGSTAAYFVALSLLPIPSSRMLRLAPIGACIVPYIWGFARTASIGNHAGALGTLLGLGWLSLRKPEIMSLDIVPYFLLINLAGNLSGWLGAAAGQGQRRDSVAVTILEAPNETDHKALEALRDAITHAVESSFDRLISRQPKQRPVADKMVIADREGRCDLLDFAESLEWRRRFFPQLRIWKWYTEIGDHSFNEIVDYSTMVLKFLVVKADIKLYSDQSSREPEKNRLMAIVSTFNETSTIVWVDDLSVRIARRIHHELMAELHARGVSFSESPFAVLHKREGTATIEQIAKRTVASKRREHVIKDLMSVQKSETLLRRFEDAFKTETWFDRFRGKRTTFVVVLIFQVLVGVTINWLSNSLVTR